MKLKYARVYQKVRNIIIHHCTLDDLKDSLQCFNPDLEREIQFLHTVEDILNKVVRKHVSFIKCDMLETLVENLELHEAETIICKYNKELNLYCKEVRAIDFARVFLADQQRLGDLPRLQRTVKFVAQWASTETTLKEIQEMLEVVFEEFSTYPELRVVKEGSTCFIFYAPEFLMPTLARLAREKVNILKKFGITQLEIGYATIIGNYTVHCLYSR